MFEFSYNKYILYLLTYFSISTMIFLVHIILVHISTSQGDKTWTGKSFNTLNMKKQKQKK